MRVHGKYWPVGPGAQRRCGGPGPIRVFGVHLPASALDSFLPDYPARRTPPRGVRSRCAGQDLIHQKPGASGASRRPGLLLTCGKTSMHQFPALPDGAEGHGAANPLLVPPVIDLRPILASPLPATSRRSVMYRGDPIALALGAVAPPPPGQAPGGRLCPAAGGRGYFRCGRGAPVTIGDVYPLSKEIMLDAALRTVVKTLPQMCAPTPAPAQAYAPYADRAGPDAPAQSPEWLVHWLALLIFFLLEPLNAVRLLRSGRLARSWWHDRPDLPAGSAQAEAASVRGPFGNSIRWMCLRHGIGPGHKDWPELSRAIVAFGGSLEGFRAGAPPCGLQWWENPGVVPGMVVPWLRRARRGDRIAAGAAGCCECSAAGAECHASRSRACTVACVMVVRIGAAGFCACRPRSADRAARLPGTANTVMSDARGRSMASPAVLIRAD